MIQRVVRQIREAGLSDDIVVATGANQIDAIGIQLGKDTAVVTEPERRDTFPAIALACSYLRAKGTPSNEPVIVMPCDSYTENHYFSTIALLAKGVEEGVADLLLMGVRPIFPSIKYGYIVPAIPPADGMPTPVARFTEKPDMATAEKLISEGALWNGGVFAFRLGYLTEITDRYMPGADFDTLRANYSRLPRISFDYEVVEKASSAAVIPYSGEWRDLGTWSTLTDELTDLTHGNVITDGCDSTYVINELEIPVVCIGAKDFVVAATPDGILVSERGMSVNLKNLVGDLGKRPMFEERRWGTYKVIDMVEFPDGHCALTKQLTINQGCSLSYQRHNCRDEVWTIIDGEGEIVIDGDRRTVGRGDVIAIRRGQWHTLRATTSLTFIEVQQGTNLVEEDIERTPYTW